VGSTVGRSSDREQNVLAVGQVLKDTLIACGIPTLHCEIAHDRVDGSDTYVGAYDRANETVQRYLALYPSIRYVIDLHRDAVFDGNGDVVRPIAVVDGEAVAQVLMVVGSGDGVDHEGNLALALALQSELNHGDAGICRQILLRPSSYRQDYAPYALLLEIGSVGNSLDEAKRAAVDPKLFKQTFSKSRALCGVLAGGLIGYAINCAYIIISLTGVQETPLYIARIASFVVSLPFWSLLSLWREAFIAITPDVAVALMAGPFLIPLAMALGYLRGPKLWAHTEEAMAAGRRRAKARSRIGANNRKRTPRRKQPEI
jgi:stage II sporulation protein P